MSHLEPLNKKAKSLLRKDEPDVYGYACSQCCGISNAGWEVGQCSGAMAFVADTNASIDPCNLQGGGWANDKDPCSTGAFNTPRPPAGQRCWWPAQVTDTSG